MNFAPIMGPWEPKLNWNKIYNFLLIGTTSDKQNSTSKKVVTTTGRISIFTCRYVI